MLISFVRTILLYAVITIALRLMGKRQIGELEPSELVVTILISELAAVPMQDNVIPLANGVVPIITLVLAELMMATLLMTKRGIRRLLCGKPSIVVRNGVVDQGEMRKCRVTIDELSEALRLKDVTDLRTVKYAIIETNGQLSVIKYYGDLQPTRQDMNVIGREVGLTRLLISDGEVLQENLTGAGKDAQWLLKQITDAGLSNPSQVFYMSINEQNEIVLMSKNEKV